MYTSVQFSIYEWYLVDFFYICGQEVYNILWMRIIDICQRELYDICGWRIEVLTKSCPWRSICVRRLSRQSKSSWKVKVSHVFLEITFKGFYFDLSPWLFVKWKLFSRHFTAKQQTIYFEQYQKHIILEQKNSYQLLFSLVYAGQR